MSTGSPSIPLLKAAPKPEQIAERLGDGPWRGLELCLMPGDVADDAAVARAVAATREGARATGRDVTLLAEAPVAWPSGAHVRVDRLDDEARVGLRRSADFAAGIASPVLTIHLFAPQQPAEYRDGRPLDEDEVQRFLDFFADACAARGVTPLIENVPPVLRMRSGGVFLSPLGGHWADLLAWRARVPALGYTFDTSHAALFRAFVAAYPGLFGLFGDEGLELERYVEELGPATEVAHVSDAAGVLGEGLPYGAGELDLDPVTRRLGDLVPYIVAEINEPDPARSPAMKAGYREVERALGLAPVAWRRPVRRLPGEEFDWPAVVGRRDPVPAVLELERRFGGSRVVLTGGAGSIGRGLATFLDGLRPQRITLLDSHEASLAADRRARLGGAAVRFDHALCDVRDRERVREEMTLARPDVLIHLAAYKHVDWAERYPEEFVATNLEGSWNVIEAAVAAGARSVVVASTDKAALATSSYGRTKRLMEQLAAAAAARHGIEAIAVRLVNVLGTAGSASDLFRRQALASVPFTITNPEMRRYWITQAHAASMLAHGALLAGTGERLATAADPAELSVGDLASRIWRQAGHRGEPEAELVGVRAGEVMAEVLCGPGETLGPGAHQGVRAITGPAPDPEVLLAVVDAPAHVRRAAWRGLLREPGGAP